MIVILILTSCKNENSQNNEILNKTNNIEEKIKQLENRIKQLEEKESAPIQEKLPTTQKPIDCNLENIVYQGKYNLYLRFFNQNGNVVEFVGKMPQDVHGKMKIEGNKLTVTEANVSGNFTFLSGCNQLVGSFRMGLSDYAVDYRRSKNK